MEPVKLKQQVKFKEWTCDVFYSKYAENGNASLTLIDSTDHSPIAIASVNPGVEIPSDYVVIKDYSENEGMVDALIKADIIEKPETFVRLSQYVNAPICKLLI